MERESRDRALLSTGWIQKPRKIDRFEDQQLWRLRWPGVTVLISDRELPELKRRASIDSLIQKQLAKRDRLVGENLGLVEEIVNTLRHRFSAATERDDLVQLGRIGLLRAAERYSELRPTKFAAFAWRHIAGTMIDAHKRNKFAVEMHERITDQEYSAFSQESFEPDVMASEEARLIASAMNSLSRTEQGVINKRFHDEAVFLKIGKAHKRSGFWAHTTMTRSLAKLRAALDEKGYKR